MSNPNDMLDRVLEDVEIGKQRPEILGKVVPIYEHDYSVLPEKIRVLFADGRTMVYDIHIDQPAPVIIENIRIIRKWKQGYVNQPKRRRNRI
ncbi:MAG: hypothetical protein J6U01_11955 [Clostridia bacterium]|nr:hypothetical protein [Clostridia bacterium]